MKKKKKQKGRREPRAYGTRKATQTGYIVWVKKVGPYLFQELRKKFNVDRPPFQRELFVPETGATLRFPYEPPDTPPLKEDDIEEWSIFHRYRNWYEDYEVDVAEYSTERNMLLLNLAVTHIEHKDRSIDVEHELREGSWIEKPESAGIEIVDRNRRYWFLMTVVLEDEVDYLWVLNEASAEEVTLGDVLRAFEYFQDVLSRSELSDDIPELTNWNLGDVPSTMGGDIGDHVGEDPERVVSDPQT